MLDLAAMARRLQLTRPIVFTDIEGTGLNPRVARIVDFGVVKLYPDGRHTVFDTLVNPGVPIPPQVTVAPRGSDCSMTAPRRSAPASRMLSATSPTLMDSRSWSILTP